MKSGADISTCGLYRYHLWRIWDSKLPICGWVMLNPSTADAKKDDATIRKCITIAKNNGFGGISVKNVFAYRAIDKSELLLAIDPVGEHNTEYLNQTTLFNKKINMLVLAWGKPFGGYKLLPRFEDVKRLVQKRNTHCIKLNKDGSPIHPLYQRNDSKLTKLVLTI